MPNVKVARTTPEYTPTAKLLATPVLQTNDGYIGSAYHNFRQVKFPLH